MPRKPIVLSTEFPYHVTARCNNRDEFFCPIQNVWEIISIELNELTSKFQTKTHAFVLMPNHFHLLISTSNGNISEVMKYFIHAITRKINAESKRVGRVFGSRYHGSIILHDQYYDCALKYIYRNPVKAGLSQKIEDYPYSTAFALFKNQKGKIKINPPIGHTSIIPYDDLQSFNHWLNQPFTSDNQSVIQKMLRKTEFLPPKVGLNNKRMDLFSETYKK